jgi:hypothetical protein
MDDEKNRFISFGGDMTEAFLEDHKEYSYEELRQLYGETTIFLVSTFREAEAEGINPTLHAFNKLLAAYLSGEPEEIQYLTSQLIPIALKEFERYGNLEPLAKLIENEITEVIQNERAREIISLKMQDNLEDRRGKKKETKREKDQRDSMILALVNYYKGMGYPFKSSSGNDACTFAYNSLLSSNIESPSPESIYKNIVKPVLNKEKSLPGLFFEAGEEDNLDNQNAQSNND